MEDTSTDIFTNRPTPDNHTPYDHIFGSPVNSDDEDTDSSNFDLITPYENLYNKNSLITNSNIIYNDNNDNIDFRIDNYYINNILDYKDITYRDFLSLLIPNIKEYILKFVSRGDTPIKLSFLLYKNNNKNKNLIPILRIYFPETKNVEINLKEKIESSIESEGYIPYDWIYVEEKYDTFTIIQEKLTKPFYLTDEFHD